MLVNQSAITLKNMQGFAIWAWEEDSKWGELIIIDKKGIFKKYLWNARNE